MGYTLLNSVAVAELCSSILRENIVQGILPIPGKGFDGRWSADYEANSISIQNTALGSQVGRKLGASTNGGYINSSKAVLNSRVKDLPLDNVYDAVTEVPQTALRANGGHLLRSVLENVPKAIDRFVNTVYFATCIAAGLSTITSPSAATVQFGDNYHKPSADTSAGYLSAFLDAGAKLGKGDKSVDIYGFDKNHTQLFITDEAQVKLLNGGSLIVGNTVGQIMTAAGGFSDIDGFVKVPDINTGYAGMFNGAVVTTVGSLFELAEGYLGKKTIANGELTALSSGALSHLAGIYVAGEGIAGAIDLTTEVKVIDLHGGQGYEVQPCARCGFVAFTPKAIQIVGDFTGLTVGDFATAASGSVTAIVDVYPDGNRA